MQIVIIPHQDSWAADFAVLKDALLQAAPSGSYIHHIGSTAIAGLPAKDVIDVQVTVDDLMHVDEARFEQAGFRSTDICNDHCPPGLHLAPSQLGKRFFKGYQRAANIHVRQKGFFNQRFALLCRDFLRARPVAAAAYGLIKQRLSDRFPTDVDFYYDIKDPVFDIIVEGANVWAEATDWVEPPAD
ncbi:GrpB family protein [Sphingobium sp. HBC34]|uniref:GrpB family protein n=1 Tax=Sphingobium cyanobacteriorum TaxID=3063954 RepID=A0ABT8ZPU7_9SPHN|nr:GrpB family protein [Sphingobium sp. HBC34]MDO7836564.1 GrpB family protein [Sphingobium sp. HBC34]